MARTVSSAIANGVAVGAHPGYPDREGFGRESGFMRGDELYDSLTAFEPIVAGTIDNPL